MMFSSEPPIRRIPGTVQFLLVQHTTLIYYIMLRCSFYNFPSELLGGRDHVLSGPVALKILNEVQLCTGKS
jgi:hypothetical protein